MTKLMTAAAFESVALPPSHSVATAAPTAASVIATTPTSEGETDSLYVEGPGIALLTEQHAIDPEQTSHVLDDLLARDDSAFVEAAYRAALGRRPDDSGMNAYLAMLRAGASKIEILGRLRYSSEGRQRGANIRNLAVRYALDTILRLPILGRLVGIAVALWSFPERERAQRRLSS